MNRRRPAGPLRHRPRRALTWTAWLMAVASCGPPSHWQAFAPTGEPVVEVVPDGSLACVRLRGRSAGCFDGVSLEGMVVSRDGAHLALPVRDRDQWRVVRDGVQGPPWNGIADVRLTPDGSRLAYAAQSDDGWRVVVDGVPGPPFDSLQGGSLQFDPSGRRVAFTGYDQGEVWAVVDADRFGPYEGVRAIRFGSSGTHVAYLARLGELDLVVRDGALVGAHGAVTHLALPHSGPDVAYVYRDLRGWWLNRPDGVDGPFEAVRSLQFPHTSVGPAAVVAQGDRERFTLDAPDRWFGTVDRPAFDSVGRSWGYIGQDSASSTVVVSGHVVAVEEWATDLVLSPRGGGYAYLAHHGEGTRVVDDTDSTSFGLVVPGSLAFFGDGSRWSCLVADVNEEELWIAAKGTPRVRPVEWAEIVAVTMGAASGSGSAADHDAAVRAWVALQAERSLGAEAAPAPIPPGPGS